MPACALTPDSGESAGSSVPAMGGPRNYGGFCARARAGTMMRGRMLDAATMLLALALDDLVLAAALWLAIPRRHRHGVAAWSTSLLLQAFSFTLIGTRGDASLGEAVSLVAIIASSALCLSLELAAIREFAKKPYAQTWHVAAVLGGAVVAAVLT